MAKKCAGVGLNAWNSAQMNNRHPWQLKKSKSWGPFWSYQLNSTANLAHLAHFLGKRAGLAGLQNGPQDFSVFFQLSWMPNLYIS